MPANRPRVILNAAMSLDGKIASRSGESKLSSEKDLRRVHKLRAQVDAIMVGVRTVLMDDPSLTVKYHFGRNPTRIIVDSYARTPLKARVIKTATMTPTIIAVTSKAPHQRLRRLEESGATILNTGGGSHVSLSKLMKELTQLGIHRLLLEGGGTLNWSMISQGLIDEISVAISPRIVGGASAVTLVEGMGFVHMKDACRLQLSRIKKYGPDVVLDYRVLG